MLSGNNHREARVRIYALDPSPRSGAAGMIVD
jgi:hypothetical protein